MHSKQDEKKEENELGFSAILSFPKIIGFQETAEFEFHFFFLHLSKSISELRVTLNCLEANPL